jgi:hypothetical protein
MGAICSSEIPVTTQRTTRRYIPEGGSLDIGSVWEQTQGTGKNNFLIVCSKMKFINTINVL